MNDRARILLVAALLELTIGDPRTRWHPVALFGRGVGALAGRAPRSGAIARLVYGAAAVMGSALAAGLAAAFGLRAIEARSRVAAVLAGGAILKVCLSYRQLEREALVVADHVEGGRLDAARESLRALVSRDTSRLSAAGACSAAIESVAENLCDSLVAPIYAFLLAGVPGAIVYRAVNTWDAMVGYHGEYEFLGKAAARLDDLANYLPARMTAGMIAVAAIAGADWRGAIARARSESGRTESPNAGWPMAAMAGALQRRLAKCGHYRLGAEYRACEPADVRRAVRLARLVAILSAVVAMAFARSMGART